MSNIIKEVRNLMPGRARSHWKMESKNTSPEEFFKTSDKGVNSALKWLLSKAQKRTLSDGTVSYFFSGFLPSRMVYTLARSKVWSGKRDQGSAIVLNWEHPDEEGGLAVVYQVSRKPKVKVDFSANDYRVPARKAKGESTEKVQSPFDALVSTMQTQWWGYPDWALSREDMSEE
jgi:hypothetical protein